MTESSAMPFRASLRAEPAPVEATLRSFGGFGVFYGLRRMGCSYVGCGSSCDAGSRIAGLESGSALGPMARRRYGCGVP